VKGDKKLQKIFYPESVAVIGVSENEGNLARNIVQNLINWEYKGDIYLVNPKGGFTFDRKIYKSVLEIEEEVDLAAILTPAHTLPQILRECGEKGIKRATISTAGFSELDSKGKSLIEKVKEEARRYNIRFVGPNGIAVMNTEIGLCLPFARVEKIPPGGNIALLVQSGGVGLSIIILLANENLYINKFVSLGNKDDLDEVDFLKYLKEDESTKIIVLYLESITRGREFMEIAREIEKPIILYKANTGGEVAKRAALSHTASLATDDRVIDAMCKQTGVIRVSQLHQIAKLAKMLTSLPPLKGNRIVAINVAGGWSVICSDCAEKNEFELPEISEKTTEGLKRYSRAGVIKFSNPLDLGDAFAPEAILRSFELSLEQENVDAIVSVFFDVGIQPNIIKFKFLAESLSGVLENLGKKYNKPLIFCLISDRETYGLVNKAAPMAIFSNPEEMFELLAKYRDYFLQDKDGRQLSFKADKSKVKGILKKNTKGKIQDLDGFEILRAYGVNTIKPIHIKNAEMLKEVSGKVSYPQVMKIYSPDILHKSDIGGIKVGIKNKQEFKESYYEILKKVKENSPSARGDGVLSYQMVEMGREVILGVKRDKSFGHILMFGLGGIYVEILKDVSFRVIPFSLKDVKEMMKEVRSSSLLYGARGGEEADISYLIEVMFKISELVGDFPEIAELDLNPLIVKEKGRKAICVDARIIID
jgi:acetyltransferase